jgi:hypothetical protein
MTDTIKISAPTTHPAGGDAVTINVQYGDKSATIMLRLGYLPSQMTETDWRLELATLAAALQAAPIVEIY